MKRFVAIAAALLATTAFAESPIGAGKTNMSLDSAPCFTWSGNTSGAFWTRCPVQAPVEKIVRVPVEKIVYVDRIVEKPVEKIVYVEVPVKPKDQ